MRGWDEEKGGQKVDQIPFFLNEKKGIISIKKAKKDLKN